MAKTSFISSCKPEVETSSEDQHDHTICHEVKMKKKLLQELAIVQELQKEYAQLNLELNLKVCDPVEKEKRKQAVENLKTTVNQFVRGVLQDSDQKGNQERLLDEVKELKRMTEQYVFGVKKDIEKIEKKHKKDKSKKNKK